MKNSVLFGGLALLLGLSACTKDGYQEVTRTLGAPAISIITSMNDGSVYVSEGTYAFTLTITDSSSTGTVTSPELIANNSSLGFTTIDQSYKSTGYDAFFENVKGTAGNTGMELTNADMLALYLYDAEQNKYGYYYNLSDAGDYTYTINLYSPWITLAHYDIGSSYRVNTFQKNTFFRGTTTTTYPSQDGMSTFETEGITYRFILNKVENSTTYKAVLVIYDAKFSGSPAEPTKAAIIVEGLDVEFTPTGINITGENIVPDVVEAGSTTPYPSFIFNNINFKTTNQYYTHGVLDYTVAGVFQGHFEGKYVETYYMK